jgi:hypothetical protein
MTDKMTVLFVRETGNVVAALTRAADPEAKITADLLAGEALLLRYAGDPTSAGYVNADFLITPDQLDVLIPDFDLDVISNPQEFWVDSDQKVVPANTVTSVTPSFPFRTQVVITLGVAVIPESKVWVQIVGPDPQDTQVVSGKIAAGATVVTINLRQLQAGHSYDILSLVQGYATHKETVVAPAV